MSSWAASTGPAEHPHAHLCDTQTPCSQAIKHAPDSRKGHEKLESVNAYIHADPTLKERALDRRAPLNAPHLGRFKPGDKLLAFLESL